MEGEWQRLFLSKHEGLPPLLYKFNTASKSYEIYITDLTQLWREQLSYKQVLKRAEEDDTTVDPGEDPGQFKVLLQKINAALCSSPGSSMALTPGSGSKTDSLHLQLSIKLPAPLKPLKWNVYLSREPYTASTNHLLLPLMRAEKNWEARQQTLLEHLKQKDWVLAKLFDKIEAMGIDLSTIFPGTSGLRGTRKETSLAQAAKYIKGVAPFNEQAWLNHNQEPSEPGVAASLLTAISGFGPDKSGLEGLSAPPDKWWESLDASRTIGVTPQPEESEEEEPVTTKELGDTNQMDIDTASEDEDDGFERQETPPKLKQQKQLEKEPQASGPGGKKPQQSPDKKSGSLPQKPQGKSSKGLDETGGRRGTKSKAKQPSPTPSPSPSRKRTPPSAQPEPEPQPLSTTASIASSQDLDERANPEQEPELEPAKPPSPMPPLPYDQETDSGSENEQQNDRPSSPPSPSKSKPKPKPKPKDEEDEEEEEAPQPKEPRGGGLGVIGGKKKAQKRQPTPEPEPEPGPEQPALSSSPAQEQAQAQAEPKSKRTGKLGVIGGRSKSKSKSAAQVDPDQKDNTSAPKSSPPGMGIGSKRDVKVEKEEEETKQSATAAARVKKDPEPEPEPEPEKETEEQKADRKREELKRQLHAKSKAPAKKKRKF